MMPVEELAHEEDSSHGEPTEGTAHAAEATKIEEAQERKKLGHVEDQAVGYIRVVVFLVLLVVATLVSLGVYFFLKNDQKEDFETSYHANADKVLESFSLSVERQLEALDALSVTYTSYAAATGAIWPNVTLPDFEVRAANTRILADSPIINFSPHVTDETRAGWEAYFNEQKGLYNTTMDRDETQRLAQDERLGLEEDYEPVGYVDPTPWPTYIKDMLPNGTVVEAPPSPGGFLPVADMSPAIRMQSFLFFNTLSHPAAAGAYRATLDTASPVMEAAANLNGENLGTTGLGYQMTLSIGQFRASFDEFVGDPTSALGYPIFDTFDTTSRKVVGMLATNLYWILYFKGVLPSTARGIICVLENNFNQTLSYRIDGQNARYLGEGDLHDPRYDYLQVSIDLHEYMASKKGPQTRAYTSVDLNGEYSAYTLRVYPSQETEAEFVNQDPLYMLLMVIAIFAFTSMVFIVYDVLVSRRQNIIMKRALASGAIVSSLFPEAVRDQIYNETAKQNDKETQKEWMASPEKDQVAGMEQSLASPRGHIAQVYPATTIMFADLAGFTQWSSTRLPEQVFDLLEAIYKRFDAAARKRKVFKIETIGDCYVAATGIPNQQEDHAVIMAKFVTGCMESMSQITNGLVETLGEDTRNLALRAGLHSGPVTGGVLRGDKGRFQLFGDSMNTAARMESNGIKGRIQVSQQTADELAARGKPSWVRPREDKIEAKGKGTLQTYWLEIKQGDTQSSFTTTTTCTNAQSTVSKLSSAEDDLYAPADC